MCRWIQYEHKLCTDPRNRLATKPFCIIPCRFAYFSPNGILDHWAFDDCGGKRETTITIPSGCCTIDCDRCQTLYGQDPNDPRWAGWIEQGRLAQVNKELEMGRIDAPPPLPETDKMIWYVPAVRMKLKSLEAFTWDQPSRPKSDEDGDEPLSPRSTRPSAPEAQATESGGRVSSTSPHRPAPAPAPAPS